MQLLLYRILIIMLLTILLHCLLAEHNMSIWCLHSHMDPYEPFALPIRLDIYMLNL